jgi:predicted AlkP superfamily pyrophosphatase or phosphodiesterase
LIRRLFLAVAAALVAVPTAAQRPPPPKLLVVISIDQVSADLFNEYRPQFSGGFARIASGTVFRNGSTAQLSTAPLGGLVKARWPASRIVMISGRASAAPAAADQRWSWTGTKFESDLAGAPTPAVVPKLNSAIAGAVAQPRPPLEPTPFCQTKPQDSRLGRAGGDAAALAASPELDGDTLALAAALSDEMQLGRAAQPDIVEVGLSATGNVARTYGSAGQAMCLQLTELDREIGDFLSLLDSRGIDYAVALAGEGVARVPIVFWRPGFRGAAVDTPVSASDIVPTLAALIELPLPAGGHCLEGTPAFCPQP